MLSNVYEKLKDLQGQDLRVLTKLLRENEMTGQGSNKRQSCKDMRLNVTVMDLNAEQISSRNACNKQRDNNH